MDAVRLLLSKVVVAEAAVALKIQAANQQCMTVTVTLHSGASV